MVENIFRLKANFQLQVLVRGTKRKVPSRSTNLQQRGKVSECYPYLSTCCPRYRGWGFAGSGIGAIVVDPVFVGSSGVLERAGDVEPLLGVTPDGISAVVNEEGQGKASGMSRCQRFSSR